MNKDLVDYIDNKILPIYESFDATHNRDTITSIIIRSLELAEERKLDKNVMYAVASLCYIGIQYEYKDYPYSSGVFIDKDPNLKKMFCKEEIKNIKEAVEDQDALSPLAIRNNYGRVLWDVIREKKQETIKKFIKNK